MLERGAEQLKCNVSKPPRQWAKEKAACSGHYPVKDLLIDLKGGAVFLTIYFTTVNGLISVSRTIGSPFVLSSLFAPLQLFAYFA